MSTRFYRPELDVLRFIAFAWVFWSHVPSITSRLLPWNEMGAFGLCLFFMLSAYLIISLLIRERAASGTVSVRSFALRRILRIWPLYFLGIALGCLSGIFWPDMRLPWQAVASMMLLATNIYVLRHGWVLGVIGALWSIAIEEQFYLAVGGQDQFTPPARWCPDPDSYRRGTRSLLARHTTGEQHRRGLAEQLRSVSVLCRWRPARALE
jgi:peptidoglycan/LPS O-acetylase OafA/YrhL